MCKALAEFLQTWRSQGPYHRESDFVFTSDKLSGRKPRTWQMVNRCYLKPAAIAAGFIKPGERFRFRLLRHSLSTWVNNATKDVIVVQTLVRHSKPDITAGTYIHGVPKENLKVQERYVRAMMKVKRSSQVAAESLMSAKPASTLIQ